MLSIAHATTGALIATKIQNPIISVPLILATHYFQDFIPHWDVGQGLTQKKKNKKAAFFQELLFDFPTSIALVYFWFQAGQTSLNFNAWLGWFVILLPDFVEFPHLFLNWKFPLLNKLSRFHNSNHHSTSNIIQGLWPQAIVLLLIYLLK